MTDNIKIPFNDVFFYGVSLKSRDINDIRADIFSNILMRYLRTLKPVSSKLYRTAENSKYEYSYSFVPSKPLYWRVIKNRRVIEEIEQLSDGKYCLNLYDEQGRDTKRVLFSRQHKWQKTNYYNSLSGNTVLCSIVPKEKNGETVILQYFTGETYPVTLYCCPAASCSEVLQSVLERVPEPEAAALTNYGLLYFAQEETFNIFKQVLKEEEERYAQLHKPEIFTTEEDVASGFCFDVSNFDSTKANGSMFDLSEAEELSEDGFDFSADVQEVASKDYGTNQEDNDVSDAFEGAEVAQMKISDDTDTYSLEADITDAIRIISDATDIRIDERAIFEQTSREASASDCFAETAVTPSSDSTEGEALTSENDVTTGISSENEDCNGTATETFVMLSDIPSTCKISEEEVHGSEETEVVEPQPNVHSSNEEFDLLAMNDEDIDDYVQTLIDSLLLDAKTVAEYKDSADDAFAAGIGELDINTAQSTSKPSESLVSESEPDSVISSNGADYFYYGDTDSQGRRCGRGKTLMSDGKTAYEGEYNEDMRHGIGSFYYKDGSLCYWGSWESNLRKGFGVGVSSETGTVHIGSWNRNKPVGIGIRFDKDGNFMYVDSASHKTNGGIRVTGFSEKSLFIEYWDENTLRTVKKEIFLDDLIK